MERLLINSRFGNYKVVFCSPILNGISYKIGVKCLNCGSIMYMTLVFGKVLIIKCGYCDNVKTYTIPFGDDHINGFRSLSEYYYKKYRGLAVKEGYVSNKDIFNRINEIICLDLINNTEIRLDI